MPVTRGYLRVARSVVVILTKRSSPVVGSTLMSDSHSREEH